VYIVHLYSSTSFSFFLVSEFVCLYTLRQLYVLKIRVYIHTMCLQAYIYYRRDHIWIAMWLKQSSRAGYAHIIIVTLRFNSAWHLWHLCLPVCLIFPLCPNSCGPVWPYLPSSERHQKPRHLHGLHPQHAVHATQLCRHGNRIPGHENHHDTLALPTATECPCQSCGKIRKGYTEPSISQDSQWNRHRFWKYFGRDCTTTGSLNWSSGNHSE